MASLPPRSEDVSVSLMITYLATGELEEVPIATNDTFGRVWLPACDRLGLELVAMFRDGGLATIPAELVPQIVSELERLRAGSVGHPDGEYLTDRCDDLLDAFARTDPSTAEYSIG